MSAVLRQIPATRRPWRYLYARGTPPALIPTDNAPMAGVGDGRTERVQSLCGPLDLTARAPDDRINRLLIAAEGQKNAAVDDGVAARIEVLATDHNRDPVFEDLTYTARQRYLYARGTPPALIPTDNAPMAGVGDGRTERVQSLCGPLDLTARAPDDRINRLLIAAEGQKNAAVDDGIAARIEGLAAGHQGDPLFEHFINIARGMVQKAVFRQPVDGDLAFRIAQRFGNLIANEPFG